MHRAARTSVGDRQLAAMVTAVSMVVFALAARLRFVNTGFSGDEPHYLVFNVALQKYHSLDVVPVYRNHDYAAFYNGDLAPHLVTAPSGPAPLHGFGGPLLWHVPYLLAGPFGAMLFIAAVSALTVTNIFLFLRERGIQRNYATMVGLLFAIGSPLFVYSSMLFVEPIAALATIYAVRVALDPRPVGARLVLASAGAAFLPWVHGRFVLLTGPLLVLLAWRVHRAAGRRPGWLTLSWSVPAILLVVGYVSYNAVVWHSLNPAPANAAHGDRLFGAPIAEGFAGLTLDRSFGLVPNFPLFALVVPGIVLAVRRAQRGVQVALALVVLPTVLGLSTFPEWWAGYSAPARFLVAIAPLLSYYVAVFLQRVHHWLADVLAVTAALASFAVALTADMVDGLKFEATPALNGAMDYLSEKLGVDPGWVSAVPSMAAPDDRPLLRWWLLVVAGGGIALGMALRRPPIGESPAPDPAPVGWRPDASPDAGVVH